MRLDLHSIITAVVTAGVNAVAVSDNLPVNTGREAAVVTQTVLASVTKSDDVQNAADMLAKATTPMPWYKSDVLRGNLVTGLGLALHLAAPSMPVELQGAILTLAPYALDVAGLVWSTVARLRSSTQPVTLTKG